jgi:hypothetical protein
VLVAPESSTGAHLKRSRGSARVQRPGVPAPASGRVPPTRCTT